MAIEGEILLPGATRKAYQPGAQPGDTSGLGWSLYTYHPNAPLERNDWVYGPGGRPVISGSSEEYGGVGLPSVYPSGYSIASILGRVPSSLGPGIASSAYDWGQQAMPTYDHFSALAEYIRNLLAQTIYR